MLIGVELLLNAANLLLVTAGSRPAAPLSAGPVLTLFVITIAAAEITVALAIILVMFRRSGHIDLTAVPDLTDDPDETTTGPARGPNVPTPPSRSRPTLAGPGGGAS